MNWLEPTKALLKAGRPCGWVTVIAAEGSVPREAGTRMVVGENGEWGTIGGGALEHAAIDQTRKLIKLGGQSWAVQDYPLGPLLNQCCGGRVRLLLERLGPADLEWLDAIRPEHPASLAACLGPGTVRRQLNPIPSHGAPTRLLGADGQAMNARGEKPGPGALWMEAVGAPSPVLHLFGAGHVGKATAPILATLPFRTVWLDTRQGAGARTLDEAGLLGAIAGAPPMSWYLVMTHSHDLDYALCRAVLRRDYRWLGLIGSATKRARFVSRLTAEGLDPTRIRCPIGIGTLRSKAPEAIAISVAAELLQTLEASA